MDRNRNMRSIKSLFVLFAIAIFTAVASAQAVELDFFSQYKWDKPAVLADAKEITTEKFPNSDTISVCDHTIDFYQPDGTYVTWIDMYDKILTERGKRSKQTLTFSFNETYSTWEIPQIEIIKPDGSSVTIDMAAQSKVMIDRSQMSMNIYDPAQKVMQIGVPGLEIGDIIHTTAAQKCHKARCKDNWSQMQIFESPAPVIDFVYEIFEPAELPLQRIELKDPVDNTVTYTTRQEAGRKVYRWEVKDVPQIFDEPAMPAYYTVTQRLLVSTAPDWKAVSKWYYNLCEPYLEPSDEMKQKVDELIAGCTTREEKIKKVFTFVSQDIRYLGIIPEGEDEAPGYQPHYVTQTFDNRHGVCRDKASLLVAMLRLA